MADKKHWMQAAFANSKNQLRRKTHTKAGHNISRKALDRESHAKSGKTRKQANLALTARKIAARKK